LKVAVVGAGAIGGLIAYRLANAGHDVGIVARDATLAALQEHGLRLLQPDGEPDAVPVRAAQHALQLGEQDVVVVALKAQALPALAPSLAPLVGPHTMILGAMNGVPWWFFDRFGGPCAGLSLESVDPGGAIARVLRPVQTLGCVVHLSATSPRPGIVQPRMGNRLIVGDPAGGRTPRASAMAELLQQAGFDVEVSDLIQRDVWFKLWGNMTMNPLSAITGATTDRLLDDELVRGFASRCMLEAQAVGERIGLPIPSTPDERHAVTRKLGAMRTSMLQDVDAGKPLELDALVGAVREIAQHLGLDTPSIDALFGLARLNARVRGLYRA
jgi:2-dehydropantoate 2-reductase